MEHEELVDLAAKEFGSKTGPTTTSRELVAKVTLLAECCCLS